MDTKILILLLILNAIRNLFVRAEEFERVLELAVNRELGLPQQNGKMGIHSSTQSGSIHRRTGELQGLTLREIRSYDYEVYQALVTQLELLDGDFVRTLVNKVGPLVRNTLQMCMCSQTAEKLKNIFKYCLSSDPPTENCCFSSCVKDYISTWFTTAHTPTTRTVAHSNKFREFEEMFESIVAPGNSSLTCQPQTGTMFSYISSLTNGRMSDKYGLEENYSDYRVQIKVFDGKRACNEPPA